MPKNKTNFHNNYWLCYYSSIKHQLIRLRLVLDNAYIIAQWLAIETLCDSFMVTRCLTCVSEMPFLRELWFIRFPFTSTWRCDVRFLSRISRALKVDTIMSSLSSGKCLPLHPLHWAPWLPLLSCNNISMQNYCDFYTYLLSQIVASCLSGKCSGKRVSLTVTIK